jgi:hypothetical protein
MVHYTYTEYIRYVCMSIKGAIVNDHKITSLITSV